MGHYADLRTKQYAILRFNRTWTLSELVQTFAHRGQDCVKIWTSFTTFILSCPQRWSWDTCFQVTPLFCLDSESGPWQWHHNAHLYLYSSWLSRHTHTLNHQRTETRHLLLSKTVHPVWLQDKRTPPPPLCPFVFYCEKQCQGWFKISLQPWRTFLLSLYTHCWSSSPHFNLHIRP